MGWDGRIMPPCGRCREYISQIHDENLGTEVMVGQGIVVNPGTATPWLEIDSACMVIHRAVSHLSERLD